MTPLTGADIIKGFELYVDDMTELSTAEELALANRVYHKICSDRPWEFLKTPATGTLSTSVPYITLPSDFSYFAENQQYTDSTSVYSTDSQAILIGAGFTPYQIVNFSDRRQYYNQSGYAYLDLANSRIVFTKQPETADTYEFDYIKIPTDIEAATSPVFPARFHPMIFRAMAIEDDVIQRFEKARSYKDENAAALKSYMNDMAYWNAKLQH